MSFFIEKRKVIIIMNKRHVIIWTIARPFVVLFAKLRFGFQYKKAENLPEKYIVLSNHVTDYDMVFLICSFPRQMYFIASEHIARWKTLYAFLKYAAEPIIRHKGTVAASTVVEALRKIKAGASVCIFAEGIRTWDGVTCPILPSTGKMIKSAKCGLVTYKISGGYFVSPGWCDKGLRKGPISGAPVNVYTKEQIQAMSVDEINEIINRDLYENAYEKQLANPQKYTGTDLAKGLDNLFYICPVCKKYETLSSEGNILKCNACHSTFTYNEYGLFENAPFKTVREYAIWQQEELKNLVNKNNLLTSKNAVLKKLIKHEETVLAEGDVTINNASFSCKDISFSLDKISGMDITGRHGLVFSIGKDYYELKAPGNTVKFLHYYRAYKSACNSNS